MKIMFTVGSLAGGGAERVVARLADKMSEMGHEIHVAMIANDKREYGVNSSVNVFFVDSDINLRGARLLSRMKNYRMHVKRINPDVILSFTASVNMFVLRATNGMSVKVIISERNNPYVDPPQEKVRKKRDKLYEQKADGFVFQTKDAKEYFSQDIQKKGTIILNPIDSGIPIPYKGEREKRIVSVGRLEKQKNQKLLIDAFSMILNKYPDYILEIYGSGSLEETLKEQINSLSLQDKVYLRGHDSNVLEHICSASLFVLPSDYEGISNALLEAMAMGMPVISTDHPIGGAKLLIENGKNGVLVPVRDSNALADAMDSILSDRKWAQCMSDTAAGIRISASLESVIDKWLSYIEYICKESVK